jgi:hypothetical protein
MRSGILTRLQSSFTTSTVFRVSTELPWSQGDNPLYLKNLKTIYVDKPEQISSSLIDTLDYNGVDQIDQTLEVFLAVDAKNPPTQLDSAVSTILSAKDYTGVTNFSNESDYTVEINNDIITYTFEFRISSVNF